LKALRAVAGCFLARQLAEQIAMKDQVLEEGAMRRIRLEIRLDLHALGRRQLAIDVGGQFRFNFFYVLGHVLSRTTKLRRLLSSTNEHWRTSRQWHIVCF